MSHCVYISLKLSARDCYVWILQNLMKMKSFFLSKQGSGCTMSPVVHVSFTEYSPRWTPLIIHACVSSVWILTKYFCLTYITIKYFRLYRDFHYRCISASSSLEVFHNSLQHVCWSACLPLNEPFACAQPTHSLSFPSVMRCEDDI